MSTRTPNATARLRTALADVGIFVPMGDLAAAARLGWGENELRALQLLGKKRRGYLACILHHLESGVGDLTEAKRIAADECGTSVDALNTMFSELRRAAENES